jgi:hypothetical protein
MIKFGNRKIFLGILMLIQLIREIFLIHTEKMNPTMVKFMFLGVIIGYGIFFLQQLGNPEMLARGAGLVIWEMGRGLYFAFEGKVVDFYLSLFLVILFIISLALLLIVKPSISKRSLIAFGIFPVIMLIVNSLSSGSVNNLFEFGVSQYIEWLLITFPFIGFAIIIQQKYLIKPLLIYSSWAATSIMFFPLSKLPFSSDRLWLQYSFWIIPYLMFFILAPEIMMSRRTNRIKNILILTLAAMSIIYISIIKWVILSQTGSGSISYWTTEIGIIKDFLLIWYPLLLVTLVGESSETMNHALSEPF